LPDYCEITNIKKTYMHCYLSLNFLFQNQFIVVQDCSFQSSQSEAKSVQFSCMVHFTVQFNCYQFGSFWFFNNTCSNSVQLIVEERKCRIDIQPTNQHWRYKQTKFRFTFHLHEFLFWIKCELTVLQDFNFSLPKLKHTKLQVDHCSKTTNSHLTYTPKFRIKLSTTANFQQTCKSLC